jgi:enoyl-CoA hydratase/carnithine racemase
MITDFTGQTLSWKASGGICELTLHHEPCNEIGSRTLDELEKFQEVLDAATGEIRALILHSSLASGFSAGADLRELYHGMQGLAPEERARGVRNFLERIHRVFNFLDELPLVTVAAVHGVAFGGGFELALTADMIVADKTARFCFPELRLGLIPGFGGIPRLTRDLNNGVIRDILMTGRSLNALKAASAGLVSQVVAEGQALRIARGVAAQITKFDLVATTAAKKFIKPVPREALRQEINIFCELFNRPVVEAALKKFVESQDVQPYLP